METLRRVRLARCPGVAETLDWAQALAVAARRPSRRGAGERDARLRPQGRRRHEALPRGAGEGRSEAPFLSGRRLVPARCARSRRDARFAALLRRQSLPISPLQTLDDACGRSRHLDLVTARRSTSRCAPLFVTRPEERPDLRSLLRGFWTHARSSPIRSARRSAGPEIPEDMADAPIDSQGARRERLALEGWGRKKKRTAASRSRCRRRPSRRRWTRATSRPSAPSSSTRSLRLTVLIAKRLARRVSRRRRPVAAARPRGPAAQLRANLTQGRDHRAALPAAQEAQGAARPALRRLGLDGPLQPLPAPVPLRAAERVRRGWRPSRSRAHLTRVTEHLKARSYREVLRRLQDVRDWSGGTRIGESLAEFNRQWGTWSTAAPS